MGCVMRSKVSCKFDLYICHWYDCQIELILRSQWINCGIRNLLYYPLFYLGILHSTNSLHRPWQFPSSYMKYKVIEPESRIRLMDTAGENKNGLGKKKVGLQESSILVIVFLMCFLKICAGSHVKDECLQSIWKVITLHASRWQKEKDRRHPLILTYTSPFIHIPGQTIPGTLGARQEYTLGGAPGHKHSHLVTRVINQPTCMFSVDGMKLENPEEAFANIWSSIVADR